jgi:hypothetical protein
MKSRHFILVMLCAMPFTAFGAHAATRDDVMYGASRCGGIQDNRAWLDCYYGAAQPMRAELGLTPAPLSQQNLVPAAIPGVPAPQSHAATPAAAPESKGDSSTRCGLSELELPPRFSSNQDADSQASIRTAGQPAAFSAQPRYKDPRRGLIRTEGTA